MSARLLPFFMLPAELDEFVEGTLPALELRLIGSAEPPRPGDAVFIGPRGAAQPATMRGVQPAKEGWITAKLPRLEGDTLYLADVGGQSEWSDLTTHLTTKNPTVVRLFEKVARQLRKKLAFAVTATNVVTGASDDHPIGYSEGARRWLERGQWRQQGVQNIRFSAKGAAIRRASVRKDGAPRCVCRLPSELR
ncbi:MAG TPA: hypothetical protein VN947_08135 [Polyangia bacterium]|nr:hypothetical protein [Polyangia bacterium]